jgi:hypothetical protein
MYPIVYTLYFQFIFRNIPAYEVYISQLTRKLLNQGFQVVMHNITKIYFEPHRWCNDQCAPSSVVDRGFEPRSGQTKDYKICICCFSSKHATLRRKSKDWIVV